MLQLTAEETAFATEFEAEAARLNDEITAFRNLPRLPYQATAEERAEREAEETRLTTLRDSHNARQQDPVAIRIGLKNQFNAFLAKTLPGGEASAFVSVANDVLVALSTDEATVGTARLLKNLVVMGLDAVNDPELHAARARGTFARYTALVATGLPEDFVRQIMIAEAARAIPMPSLPSVSSKR